MFPRNRILKRSASALAGLVAVTLVSGLLAGCDLFGGVLLPGGISSVQLFDQPNFTVAFSVGVPNPQNVSRVNWVFGDGSGFVQGAANRTTITYQYAATGTYSVTAFVFESNNNNAKQINGAVTVQDGTGGGGGGSGGPTTLPGQIFGANPADFAQNVSVETLLTWTAGSSASSHDVYLGTVQADVENATHDTAGIFQGNQTSTAFDPPALLPDTTYFWRIDEVNALGTTKGTVRRFTTAKAPGKAMNPVPTTGSNNARVDQVLQFTAGTDATSHDVFFGDNLTDVTNATTDTPDIFKGNQTALTFDPEDDTAVIPGQLLASHTYFWRIDEHGPGGATTGDIWTFTTRAPPPQITNPMPPDTAVDVAIDAVLSWTASSSIESFDVYLGTDPADVALGDRNSPEFKGNQTTTLFIPGTLLNDTDYFWRIDTLGPGGTTTGIVFMFHTAQPPPAPAAPFAPLDNATMVDVETALDWDAGVGGGPTDSFDVYLSTNQNSVNTQAASALVDNTDSATTMHTPPSPLAADTQFFWRIVSVGPGGRTPGAVLRFRTAVLPSKATTPIPGNNAQAVAPDVVLMWTAGANAASHDVFFGTSQTAVTNATTDDAEFRGNQPVGDIDFNPPAGVPSALAANTSFFWRIDERGPGGVRKGDIWTFKTGPGKAINPQPSNAATDVVVTRVLQWTAGSGASMHDVYLGTNATDVLNATPITADIFRGTQASTTFDPPGDLAANTQFFWRIDEVAADGVTKTKGDVWTFTTELGKATNPDPADMATSVPLDQILSWTAGAGADMHDVYFGTTLAGVSNATTASGEFRGQQANTDFDPTSVMAITANTTYFWRIDTVALGGAPVRKGDVWRYTTLAPPAQVSGPSPLNGATGVSTATSLSWAAASGADEYDVYFIEQTANAALPPADRIAVATTTSPAFQGTQAGLTFAPGALVAGTTYLWRIDSKNDAGTTTGVVFSFTTAP